MRQNLGRANLQLVGVEYTTLNGPCHLGANLALGCVVWMFVPSSQTRSPGLNWCDGILGPVRFMVSATTFRVAVTSDQI
jgi:hypothetical protein